MAKQVESDDLKDIGLISKGVLGVAFGVGPARIDGVARRLGIKPKKMLNGRDLFSFAQASDIVRTLLQ